MPSPSSGDLIRNRIARVSAPKGPNSFSILCRTPTEKMEPSSEDLTSTNDEKLTGFKMGELWTCRIHRLGFGDGYVFRWVLPKTGWHRG